MKRTTIVILSCLLLSGKLMAQQGSSCSNPFPLVMDGTQKAYAPSSTTGSSVVCTAYTGTSPVTWFSITTNGQAQCPLLDIQSDAQCEIAMYTACNGGQALQSASSMCFDDGTGLWAPSETQVLQPNTTYLLRIKTAGTDTIRIAAQYHPPANNTCTGASSVGTDPFTDNNACHQPGPGVLPDQLCAFSLENTAFYQFYVASAGSAIINISSISCDNGSQNNSSGFQIGFFTGNCGALSAVNCTSGTGSFVQASTNPLPANTHVYVAIDGMAGSNCLYSISGINVFGVLAAEQFKHFTVWNQPAVSALRWQSQNDASIYYEVERSLNGKDFIILGRINRTLNGHYNFEDKDPQYFCYYRLRQMNTAGRISLSPVIVSQRKDLPVIMELASVSRDVLNLSFNSTKKTELVVSVSNLSGQLFFREKININKGKTAYAKMIASLPAGRYHVSMESRDSRQSRAFMKF